MHNTSEIHYTRLPGKGLRRQGFFAFVRIYCTLWLANDHLLNVDNRVFAEDYKRFYFRDIQAIITQRTNRGKVWNGILLSIIGIAVLLALLSKGIEATVAWLVVAGIFGIFLLINWLRGPTCTCHIITAVQHESLPSLDRLKTAERVMRILHQHIQGAQGILKTEELEMTGFSNQPEVSGSPFHFIAQASSKQPTRHYHGGIHGVAFGLLLVEGIFAGLHLFAQHVALNLVSLGVSLIFTVCVIIALVKQYNTDISKGIRWVTWSSFAYICISYFISYALTAYLSVLLMGPLREGMTQWEFYKTVAELSPYDYPVLLGLNIFSIVCAFLLGGIGFAFLKQFWQQNANPPSPPEPV